MAVSVKKITLWRREVENTPGTLARLLAPLASSGADLQVLMGYRFPGNESRAAVELFPVSGAKLTRAARQAGFEPSAIPALLVEGDNRAGLGYAFSTAVAEAGINMGFVVAQVVGRRYAAVFGFDNEGDLARASALIKKTAARRK